MSPQKRAELSTKAIDKWASRQSQSTSARILKQEAQAQAAAAQLKKRRLQKRSDRLANQQKKRDFAPVQEEIERPHERMSPSLLAQAVQRTKHLLALQAGATEGGFMLDSYAVEEYLLRGPRTYNVLLTFTALGSNWQCTHCSLLNEAAKPMLASLVQQQAPLLSASDADTLFKDGYPTVSVLIDPNKNAMLWRSLALQQAPLAVLLPPTFTAGTYPAQSLINASLPRFQLTNTPTAADIITFLQRNHAPAPPAPGAQLDMTRVTLVLVAIVAAGASAYFFWDGIVALPLSRFRLPSALGFLCAYIFSVTGFKFNSLQNVPFSEVDRYGVPEYIAAGFQRQYGAESFILFFIYSTLVIGIVLLIGSAYQKSVSTRVLDLTPPVNEKYHATVDDTETDANLAGVILSRTSPLAVAVFVGVILFAYVQLLAIFSKKQPAYNFGFVW